MAVDSCSSSTHNLAAQYANQLATQRSDHTRAATRDPNAASHGETASLPNGPVVNSQGQPVGTVLNTAA
jgi:hypothetical protein